MCFSVCWSLNSCTYSQKGTAMSPSWTDLITGILWVLFVRVLPILAVLIAVAAVIYLLVYRLPRALLRRREGTKDTD